MNGRPSVLTPALPKLRVPASQLRLAEACQSDGESDADERSDDGNYFADRCEKERRGEDAGLPEETVDNLDLPDLQDDYDSDTDEDNYDIFDEDDMPRSGETDSDEGEDEDMDPSEVGPKSFHTYLFCPAPHRLTILRLFTKHACLHSLLPERHGQPRTAADIRRDAVFEMYTHCHSNHLSEVWGYLWTSWYSRKRWHISKTTRSWTDLHLRGALTLELRLLM